MASLRLQGDLNGNGHLEVADVMSLLFNLFGPVTLQPCESEASNRELQHSDGDGDGQLTIVDGVRVLNYLYLAGEPPARGRDCVLISGCPGACD